MYLERYRIWYRWSGVFHKADTLQEAVAFVGLQIAKGIDPEDYEIRQYSGHKRVDTFNHLGESIHK